MRDEPVILYQPYGTVEGKTNGCTSDQSACHLNHGSQESAEPEDEFEEFQAAGGILVFPINEKFQALYDTNYPQGPVVVNRTVRETVDFFVPPAG